MYTVYYALGMYFKLVILTQIIGVPLSIFETVIVKQNSLKPYQMFNIANIANWTQNVRLRQIIWNL